MNTKRQEDIMRGIAAPWLWLDAHENEAHDDDKNVILLRDYNGGGPAVFIPPAMEAAPELLEALKMARDLISNAYERGEEKPIELEKIVAAIAKAEGR